MDRLVATRPNVRLARRHDRTYLRSIIHCCTREVMALDDQPEARDEQLDDVVEPPELGVPVALVVSRPRAKVAIVEEELEPVQTPVEFHDGRDRLEQPDELRLRQLQKRSCVRGCSSRCRRASRRLERNHLPWRLRAHVTAAREPRAHSRSE